mmetsp:Transcript_21479/g.69361  ORF Transcript_21479/g.69361 Transcript_21479/m.69361 type:complete len:256 (-) Transcript_21479:9-776(-)
MGGSAAAAASLRLASAACATASSTAAPMAYGAASMSATPKEEERKPLVPSTTSPAVGSSTDVSVPARSSEAGSSSARDAALAPSATTGMAAFVPSTTTGAATSTPFQPSLKRPVAAVPATCAAVPATAGAALTADSSAGADASAIALALAASSAAHSASQRGESATIFTGAEARRFRGPGLDGASAVGLRIGARRRAPRGSSVLLRVSASSKTSGSTSAGPLIGWCGSRHALGERPSPRDALEQSCSIVDLRTTL